MKIVEIRAFSDRIELILNQKEAKSGRVWAHLPLVSGTSDGPSEPGRCVYQWSGPIRDGRVVLPRNPGYDLLICRFRAEADGEAVIRYLRSIDPEVQAETYPLTGDKGVTHMVKIRIPGEHGKTVGCDAPTLGILGRLGGLGARPEMIGYVSDGDGALAALAVAAKVLDMHRKGDLLPGDLFFSTHVCPNAPTRPHDPVPFMDSPVSIAQVNQEEVSPELDAILSIDTTKGNRVINTRQKFERL